MAATLEVTADEVAALERQLARLIANHQTAEAAYAALSRRPDPPYMDAARTPLGLTEQQRALLEEAYEADSGLLAVSDASDAAYERMINFIQQVLGLPSFSRDACV